MMFSFFGATRGLAARSRVIRAGAKGLAGILLCTTFAAPAATIVTFVQTNLDFWAREMEINLTAVTNGPTATNGIVTTLTAPGTRFTSETLLQVLDGSPVLVINKGYTNYAYKTTNYFVAYPALTPATYTHSPSAKLLVLTPLGAETFAPIIAVRPNPRQPQLLYSLDSYLRIAPVTFTGATNAVAVSGALETVHHLAATSTMGIKEFTFNAYSLADVPPTSVYFDVQGYTTERQHDVVEAGLVVGGSVPQSAVAVVAGTGQLSSGGSLAIFHGTITLTTGSHFRE